MESIAELKAWISRHFWKAEQLTSWVKGHFFLRVHHRQTRTGTSDAALPIITNSSGYVDPSFINGTNHAEFIADTVGAMVTGNTETGITVTYQDSNNTLDFVVAAQDHGGLSGLSDDDHAQYLLLAGRSGGQTLTGLAGTGETLTITRDQSSGNTDSPVVLIHQDNASDDQQALSVIQDASGVSAIIVRRTGSGGLVNVGSLSLTEGANTFITGFYRGPTDDTQATVAIIRSTSTDTVYNAGVTGDSFRRLTIDAAGLLSWGPGSVTRDTTLGRTAGGGLTLNSVLTATGINVGEDDLTVFDEGTYTPAITASGTNPTVTYGTRTGKYQLINKKCFVHAYVPINTYSAGTGDARVSLPFTAASNEVQSISAVWNDSSGLIYPCSVVVGNGVAYATIIVANGTVLASSGLGASDYLLLTGSYFIA